MHGKASADVSRWVRRTRGRRVPLFCRDVFLVAVILTLASLAASSIKEAQQVPPAPSPPGAVPVESAKPSVQAPNQLVLDEATVVKQVLPKRGEICMVCIHPIQESDVVFWARGHRVPIHRAELDANLRGQLRHLLAQLEPRGAFIGAGQHQAALSLFWFFAGLYVVLGLIFAALCAHCALHRGRNPVAWFAVGLTLNVVGYCLLMSRPRREPLAPAGVPRGLRKVSATHAPQPCAKCGGLNHPCADACIGCGTPLEPKTVSEAIRAGLRSV